MTLELTKTEERDEYNEIREEKDRRKRAKIGGADATAPQAPAASTEGRR